MGRPGVTPQSPTLDPASVVHFAEAGVGKNPLRIRAEQGARRMADDSTTVAALRQVVADFVAEREWQRYHDPKNLAMSIAIETGELMEHFQWVRNEELADLLSDDERRGEIIDEIADITCYIMALANVLDVDLSEALTGKMKKNERKYPAEEFKGRYFKPGGSR